MDPIANNPYYVAAVQSTAKQTKIQNIPEVTSQSSSASAQYSSQDNKNAEVSEKPDTQQDFTSFNLRFQQSVPASNLLPAAPSFNEINSSYDKKNSAKSKKYSASGSSSGSSGSKARNLGFYIVNNSSGNNVLVSAQQKIVYVKQQIAKTYHLDNSPDVGSLINVTYY